MKHLHFVFLFFIFAIVSTGLFQNCTGMEAVKLSSDHTGDGDGDGKSLCPTPKNSLLNRWLDDTSKLDNPKTLNDQGEFNDEINYSVDSDMFYYETTHPGLPRCKSTIVSIGKNFDSEEIELKVDADTCEKSRSLYSDEQDQLMDIIRRSLNSLSKKDSSSQAGCRFPRLSVDTKSNGHQDPDFEIYYASAECVRIGESFVSITDAHGVSNFQNAQLIQETKDFFNGLIDDVCP